MILDSDDGERPWEESYRTTKGSEEEGDDNPETNENCFCQQIRQHGFIRKLEQSARVQFDWVTFWKELVYHTFFPLTLPLIYLCEGGTNGLINRQFWKNWLGISQWMQSICFFMLNGLTPLYISPDIVIVNILWIMRNMILATKYGFISKVEMQEMRERVLPMSTHRERTLVLAWTNPIPLRVLKRELLLAAIRKDKIRCMSSLRLVPGASYKLLRDVMNQLTSKSEKDTESCLRGGSSRRGSLERDLGINQTFSCCQNCVRNGCTKDRFEDRWIDICLTNLSKMPGMHVPEDSMFTEMDESSSNPNIDDHRGEKGCPALDLPAILLAAYIIQRSGDILEKKNILHQIYSNPWRVYWASAFLATLHSVIPFASRAISGKPSTFGGHEWYHIIVSFSSLVLNYSSMSASVMFMLAGTADFRRRYFSSRLLNTLLKDGWYGEERKPKKRYKLKETRFHKKKSVFHVGLASDFSDPRSMAGWWSVRVLVQDFGLVFYMRVKVNSD